MTQKMFELSQKIPFPGKRRLRSEAAAEQFRVAGNKYQRKAVLVKDVLQAQAQTSDTSFKYQQALSSYWTALAELRKATGEE
jgi:outer membrane protein TolC